MKLCTLFFFQLLLSTTLVAQVQTRQLIVEPNHSSVGFAIPIAHLSRVTGKFTDYAINIQWPDQDLTKASFEARIKVASINTGIPGRDKHLQSAMFFDAANYPEIIFKSSKIEKKTQEKDSYIAYGSFTMRGVTKSVALPFRFTGQSGKNTLGFSIRWVLNRLDYGVGNTFKHTHVKEFLGNNIAVEIDFWTRKPRKKKK